MSRDAGSELADPRATVGGFSRERRCELLAAADREALVDLAERCLDHGIGVTVLSGPEVGVIALQVREPIARERFYLGEVLVTQVEVDVDGHRGWAMRMGSDREAALALAVLDAVAEAHAPPVGPGSPGAGSTAGDPTPSVVLSAVGSGSGRPVLAEIEELCRATESHQAEAEADEWAELAPTEVSFEELD